jgi:hypothetical protein
MQRRAEVKRNEGVLLCHFLKKRARRKKSGIRTFGVKVSERRGLDFVI